MSGVLRCVENLPINVMLKGYWKNDIVGCHGQKLQPNAKYVVFLCILVKLVIFFADFFGWVTYLRFRVNINKYI